MKRGFFWRLLMMAIVTALFCSAVSVFLAQREYEDELLASLQGTLQGIGRTVSVSGDRNALARTLAANYRLGRVTLIQKNGVVQGDSEADYRRMENHSGRPEVQQALDSGSGVSIRRSATLGQDMLYAAVRLRDGSVLRAAMPMRSVNSRILHTLPVVALTAVLALLGAALLAGRFTRTLLRPVRNAVAGMEDIRRIDYGVSDALLEDGSGDEPAAGTPARESLSPDAIFPDGFRPAGETDGSVLKDGGPLAGADQAGGRDTPYEELRPLLDEVERLSATVRRQVGMLAAQRDKLAFVFDRVTQGIVLVEADTRVAQINRAARLYLTGSENTRGTTLYDYIRRPEVTRAAEACLKERASAVFDLSDERQGRVLCVSIGPVDSDWIHGGAMVLVTDVTQDRRAGAMRREFVANASHELKTPVTSIRGFAELISAGIVKDPAQIRDYIGRIQAEADRMAALVSDILALSALEDGAEPKREAVDVFEQARQTVQTLMPQAQKARVTIALHGGPVSVLAPRGGLRRLFDNLTENAVKYNRPGGRVDVTVRERDGRCEITVADTGVGIPPAAVPRIFERFYRADPGRSRATGGTGLGLSIVKHVVSRLGGTISVQSRQGVGTTFVVQLPEKG